MTTAVRRTLPNWMTFPRELRDAIPEFEPCRGRVLQLERADVAATGSPWTGPRVAIDLTVCETGKLSGVFHVWVELDPHAARALADRLQSAADDAIKP